MLRDETVTEFRWKGETKKDIIRKRYGNRKSFGKRNGNRTTFVLSNRRYIVFTQKFSIEKFRTTYPTLFFRRSAMTWALWCENQHASRRTWWRAHLCRCAWSVLRRSSVRAAPALTPPSSIWPCCRFIARSWGSERNGDEGWEREMIEMRD